MICMYMMISVDGPAVERHYPVATGIYVALQCTPPPVFKKNKPLHQSLVPPRPPLRPQHHVCDRVSCSYVSPTLPTLQSYP